MKTFYQYLKEFDIIEIIIAVVIGFGVCLFLPPANMYFLFLIFEGKSQLPFLCIYFMFSSLITYSIITGGVYLDYCKSHPTKDRAIVRGVFYVFNWIKDEFREDWELFK